MASRPSVESDVSESTVSVAVDPALELGEWDQQAAPAADHPQVVQHVMLEEVDADAEGRGGLCLRQRKARDRLLDDRLDTSGAHDDGAR
jgi:hypothetical protein